MDTASIGLTIGLVTQGLSALDKTTDIAGRLKGLIARDNPDTVELERLVGELHVELAQANLKQARLMSALAEMEKSAIKEDEARAKRLRYQVFVFPTKNQVLRLREPDPDKSLPQYVCPKCVEQDAKFFGLQFGDKAGECPGCGQAYYYATPEVDGPADVYYP